MKIKTRKVYTNTQKINVVNKVRPDKELARELNLSVAQIHMRRSKWKKKFTKSEPVESNPVIKEQRMGLKESKDILEVKTNPCKGCGQPTDSPDRICLFCKQEDRK